VTVVTNGGAPPGAVPALEAPGPPESTHAVGRADVVRIALVGLATLAVWSGVWEPFARLSLIGLAATLAGGYPIFREAWENIRERRMTMELSMTIALVAALLIGEVFTALLITLFVLIAEVLENLTVARGRHAIGDLLKLLPRTAVVRRGEDIFETSVSELRPGDTILIRPGALIPADGAVITGRSFVDQGAITGESQPVEKVRGDVVYAGTVNQAGALEVWVERMGRDSSFGKIVQVVEAAEQTRAPIQKTADRLAGYLVYVALGAAALTFILTHNMRSTIAVIIVAGACGVAAGTPLAILGGIGRAARLGAIVKGGLYLETLARVDTVVLDKTGTVTFGTPRVSRTVPVNGVPESEVLGVAAAAERPSEHPLGQAIVRRAAERGFETLTAEAFVYQPGHGVTARIQGAEVLVGNHRHLTEHGVAIPRGTSASDGTEIHVAKDGRYLGSIQVDDTVRPEARGAVQRLKALGIHVLLLTGDTAETARSVARELAVGEVAAGLLPEQKLERVRALVASGRTVAMVGDGVNDAPALVAADVGVAMGSGTAVARESADIVLLGNDLEKLVETLQIARRARTVIYQNFTGTLTVDAVGVVLAAYGFLPPVAAAVIHVTSELLFILNSARLLPQPGRPTHVTV
jgi:Cd2+/Zn2+-exporting ATPase/Cu+-exporting ATPase